MLPFVAARYGSAAAESKLGPSTLTAKIPAILSALASASERIAPAPALFTRMSTRPQALRVSVMVRAASAGIDTSAVTPAMWG